MISKTILLAAILAVTLTSTTTAYAQEQLQAPEPLVATTAAVPLTEEQQDAAIFALSDAITQIVASLTQLAADLTQLQADVTQLELANDDGFKKLLDKHVAKKKL